MRTSFFVATFASAGGSSALAAAAAAAAAAAVARAGYTRRVPRQPARHQLVVAAPQAPRAAGAARHAAPRAAAACTESGGVAELAASQSPARRPTGPCDLRVVLACRHE